MAQSKHHISGPRPFKTGSVVCIRHLWCGTSATSSDRPWPLAPDQGCAQSQEKSYFGRCQGLLCQGPVEGHRPDTCAQSNNSVITAVVVSITLSRGCSAQGCLVSISPKAPAVAASCDEWSHFPDTGLSR